MQERYLGDSHDFVKYSLLRFLAAELNLRIGINWYLTCPMELSIATESGHGEKRQHLLGKAWSWDNDLKERLSVFSDPEVRNLEELEKSGALPAGVVTFAEPVPSTNHRGRWSQRALEHFRDTDLIFLDPDVGLEVSSMTPARSTRYAFFRELAEIRQAGKIAVAIQFARQCDPVKRAAAVRAHIAASFPEDSLLPVLRARTAPNVLFMFSAPLPQHQSLHRAIVDFSARAPSRLEIVT